MAVHDRPCKECVHYGPRAFADPERVGLCNHKDHGPSYVTADMHVTYYVTPGPGHYDLCFEAKVQ